jgi:hypothetical protein
MEIIQKKCTKEERKAAYEAGFKAAKKGLHRMLNPYGIGVMDLFCEWERGYDDGCK